MQTTRGCAAPDDLSGRPLKAMILRRSALAPRTYSSLAVLPDNQGQLETVSLSRGRLPRLLTMKHRGSGS